MVHGLLKGLSDGDGMYMYYSWLAIKQEGLANCACRPYAPVYMCMCFCKIGPWIQSATK